MSWQQINYRPCTGLPNCAVAYRTVYAQLNDTGGTLAGNDNMIAWLNNFDIDTVNWGCTTYATFNHAGDTTPAVLTPNYQDGGRPYSVGFYYFSLSDLTPSDNSVAAWSQVLLNAPHAYMCLAVGFTTGADSEFVLVQGCTAPLPKNPGCAASTIITLPLPDPSIGDYCQEYLFALVGPNTTGGPTGLYPNLDYYAQVIGYPKASGFNSGQVCQPPDDDPFTGNPAL